MNLNEANKLWFNFEPIDGVLFGLNDYVRINSGEFAGNGASVISLISLKPTAYLDELDFESGGDLEISQSDLEKAE